MVIHLYKKAKIKKHTKDKQKQIESSLAFYNVLTRYMLIAIQNSFV